MMKFQLVLIFFVTGIELKAEVRRLRVAPCAPSTHTNARCQTSIPARPIVSVGVPASTVSINPKPSDIPNGFKAARLEKTDFPNKSSLPLLRYVGGEKSLLLENGALSIRMKRGTNEIAGNLGNSQNTAFQDLYVSVDAIAFRNFGVAGVTPLTVAQLRELKKHLLNGGLQEKSLSPLWVTLNRLLRQADDKEGQAELAVSEPINQQALTNIEAATVPSDAVPAIAAVNTPAEDPMEVNPPATEVPFESQPETQEASIVPEVSVDQIVDLAQRATQAVKKFAEDARLARHQREMRAAAEKQALSRAAAVEASPEGNSPTTSTPKSDPSLEAEKLALDLKQAKQNYAFVVSRFEALKPPEEYVQKILAKKWPWEKAELSATQKKEFEKLKKVYSWNADSVQAHNREVLFLESQLKRSPEKYQAPLINATAKVK
jgi:hypothetical protein